MSDWSQPGGEPQDPQQTYPQPYQQPYPQGQYPQGQYQQNQYPQGQPLQGQYPQNQYPQNQYPQGQYPPAAYQQPDQQYQPYGAGAGATPYAPIYGYPFGPPGERRPGSLTAAAVLGYVCGGLLILAAILVFFGASIVTDTQDYVAGTSYGPELVVAGIANLIAAGLLIAGSVSMTGRNAQGRRMYVIGSAIVLVATVYWIARWAPKGATASVTVYALIFAALVIIGLGLAFNADARSWLGAEPRSRS